SIFVETCKSPGVIGICAAARRIGACSLLLRPLRLHPGQLDLELLELARSSIRRDMHISPIGKLDVSVRHLLLFLPVRLRSCSHLQALLSRKTTENNIVAVRPVG